MPRNRDPLPLIGEIAINLLDVRAIADENAISAGRDWYPSMGRMIAQIARDASVDTFTACGVFAAFSQNATWRANITMATNYLFGTPRGMKSVLTEADCILEGAGPDVLVGKGGQSKRPDFWRNLAGQHEYVTCDRWHLRAAFNLAQYDNAPTSDLPTYVQRKASGHGTTLSVKLTPEVRDLITRATRIVAAQYDETASACQAIIWCAIRGSGE